MLNMMLVVIGLFVLSVVADVNSQQSYYPYVSFMSQNLTNHSYVDLSRVRGNGSNTIQCITDLETCCSVYGQGIYRGDWYFPNGDRLPFFGGGDIIEHRYAQRVDIRRFNNANSPTGIYRCDISTNEVHHPINNSLRATVYVGLYASGGGDITVSGDMKFTEVSDVNGPNPQFILTCISTGGPATTVTWTRELFADNRIYPATNITDGLETVLANTTTSLYTHTLTVTGRLAGLYTCTVANNKPSTDSASRCTLVEVAPTSFVAVVGSDGVIFYWSPSPLPIITNFTLFCSPSPSTLPQTLSSQAVALTVTGFSLQTPYSCSLVEQNCIESGPPATLSFTTYYTYFQLLLKGITLCPNFTESDREKKLEDAKYGILQRLRESGCSECNSYMLDEHQFSCYEEFPAGVTYRARLWGTSERDTGSLTSLIDDWVRDGGAGVILTGLLMTLDPDCPVTISSLRDPHCSPVVSTPSPSPIPSSERTCTCTNNTPLVIAGVVMVIVALMIVAGASLTIIIIYRLRTKGVTSLDIKTESERKRDSLQLSTNVAYHMKTLTSPQELYETIDTVDTTDTNKIPTNTSHDTEMNPSLPPRSTATPAGRHTASYKIPAENEKKAVTSVRDSYEVTTVTGDLYEDTAAMATMVAGGSAYKITEGSSSVIVAESMQQDEYEPV